MCLLSGCSTFAVKSGITNLLAAPKLSTTESEIATFMNEYLGESVSLRYSQSMGYTSPIQLIDIDEDGTDEAVVFYYALNKGTNIRLAVLSQTAESWSVIMDKEGLGSDVFFFETTEISGLTGQQIVVGYQTPNIEDKFFVTYFTDRNIADYTERCENILIGDVNRDSGNEIILTDKLTDDRIRVKAVEFNGSDGFDTIGTRILAHTNIQITQMELCRIKDGKNVLYIDYRTANNTMHTEFGYFTGGKMTDLIADIPIVDKQWEFEWNLNCTDINGDGVLDVPTILPLNSEYDDLNMRYIEWFDYSVYYPQRVYYGVCDTRTGIFTAIPNEWQNLIHTQANEENGFVIMDTQKQKKLVEISAASEEEEIESEYEQNLPLKNKIVKIGAKYWNIEFSRDMDEEQKEYVLNSICSLY